MYERQASPLRGGILNGILSLSKGLSKGDVYQISGYCAASTSLASCAAASWAD